MAAVAGAVIGGAIKIAGGMYSSGKAKDAAKDAAEAFTFKANEQLRVAGIGHKQKEALTKSLQMKSGANYRYGTARRYAVAMQQEHKRQRDHFRQYMRKQASAIEDGGQITADSHLMSGITGAIGSWGHAAEISR